MTSIYDAELLLVDDNPDLLRLLCEQLSGAGYHHIRTAATCAAARAAFDAAPPHLMVLDINLPDGDGFSLFRALPFPPEHPAQKAGAQHEHQQHDAHRRQQIPPEKARKDFHERTSPANL